jgi:S-adenosylmethionine decarboxylase
VKLFVALAIFEGCPAAWLDSPAELGAALEKAITAGKFTRYSVTVQPFEPHGVTACAIVGESHLALHSWPEEGRLFVDVASCSTVESVQRAIEAIGRAMPAGRLALLDERVLASPAAGAPLERALRVGAGPDPAE